MTPSKIKPELLDLLVSGKFDSFTCPALTQAYFASPRCTSPTKRAASQIVARAVKALEGDQLIVGTSSTSGRAKQYQLTEDFYRIFSVARVAPLSTQEPNAPNESFLAILEGKLHEYKIELLEAIGEVEEYEELSKTAPEKRSQIQVLYDRARDQFSRTQGRVKAIEAVLAEVKRS
ncbi:hypothetical protein JF535_11980 [Microbulbifer salipaludis]|uniref:Uncharacterized protein n=1 Tax=Microbulbifer salipaludis TaxID=187980 RepID=A0ABS3E8D8_9GAMM|nr:MULTISPECIES: hypothetical protein [Microbulbifer]MBN8431572.1 hypothetical protein [Microbulbifer salipaludis]MCK7596801.1 hypothetical protein [Microbulbifer sp. CAU 1566]